MFGPGKKYKLCVKTKNNPNLFIFIGLLVSSYYLVSLSLNFLNKEVAPNEVPVPILLFGMIFLSAITLGSIFMTVLALVILVKSFFVYMDSKKVIKAALHADPECIERAITKAAKKRLHMYAQTIQAVENTDPVQATENREKFSGLFEEMQSLGLIPPDEKWDQYFKSEPLTPKGKIIQALGK